MPRQKIDPKVKALLKACDTFGRACAMMESLPSLHRPDDSKSLRETLPGAWPTVGELRTLYAEMVKLGWSTETFR
jgi:hypothetical protein